MKPLVTDALWERLAPLLPPPPQRRFRFPGRKPLDYRKILTGILFVLKTGIAWEDLPADVFGCSGMTCWRRLRDWARAGVFLRLQRVLLDDLGLHGAIDWSRAAFDSSSVRAVKGGSTRCATPRIAANPVANTTC